MLHLYKTQICSPDVSVQDNYSLTLLWSTEEPEKQNAGGNPSSLLLLHIRSTTALLHRDPLTIITTNIYLHIQTDAQGGDVEAGGTQAAAFYGINLPKPSQPATCERSGRACLPNLGKQFIIPPLCWTKLLSLALCGTYSCEKIWQTKATTHLHKTAFDGNGRELSRSHSSRRNQPKAEVKTPAGQRHLRFSPALPVRDCNGR